MISTTYTGEIYDATTAAEVTQTDSDSALGQEAFLKMFLAQVTNQNPLDPMDNTEYTAQLAVFSQLEQLTKIAGSVEGIDDLSQAIGQNAALGYLGKEVTLDGNLLPVSDGYVGTVDYSLASACTVRAVITDENGDTVAEVDLGTQDAGAHQFIWDGTTTAGQAVPDGVYQVYLTGYDPQGDVVEAEDLTVTGLVTGYQKDSDGTQYLLLGEAALPLSDVISVRQPTSTSSGDTNSSFADWAESQSSEEDDGSISSFLENLVTLGGLAAALL